MTADLVYCIQSMVNNLSHFFMRSNEFVHRIFRDLRVKFVRDIVALRFDSLLRIS